MKRALLLLLPASLLVFLAISGCNDESLPRFTRVQVSPACGVAPMQVESRAFASGGNESGSPTGGNNNLEITWNFGDGGTGQTSVAYHTYQFPEGDDDGHVVFDVVVTGTDSDGNSTTAQFPVTVLADSLLISASSSFPGGAVAVTDTVHFDVTARACDIDPDVDGDYVKMNYRWDIDGQTYTGRRPQYQFPAAGDYQVLLSVTYPALAVTRHDTLDFTVSVP